MNKAVLKCNIKTILSGKW
uniref:Uncharacterized protein n=1 Tax=Anguilla anguilla TaxID=7936 RepID=A0A0E9W5N9_ANGAN